MKIVPERILEFKRGEDGREALQIGKYGVFNRLRRGDILRITNAINTLGYSVGDYIIILSSKIGIDQDEIRIEYVEKYNESSLHRFLKSKHRDDSAYYTTGKWTLTKDFFIQNFELVGRDFNLFKKVDEGLDFKRGGNNPKRTLGLGWDEEQAHFDSYEHFLNWLILGLPRILNTKGIPPDILKSRSGGISWPYFHRISGFLSDSKAREHSKMYTDEILKGQTTELAYQLENMGFERIGYHEDESYSPYFLDNK